MNYTVLDDRVLVKTNPHQETTTQSGLIISPTEAKSAKGTVIDIGVMYNGPVTVGQNIIYGKYGGIPITLEGQEYVLLESDEILITLN